MSSDVVQFINHLSIEKGLSKNTISSYRRDLSNFQIFLNKEEIAPGDLNTNILNSYLAHLRKENIAEASIARAVVVLRNFARFCEKEGGIPSLLKDFEPPRVPKRLPKALPIETINRIIDSVSIDDAIGLRDRTILELLYSTGARISELVELKVRDLSNLIEQQTLKLFGKGNKERVVPVGSMASKSLEDYLVRSRPMLLKGKRGEALFLNSRGEKISRQIVWQIIQERSAKAGVNEHLSPHTFRHSFATHLIDGGADIRVVQELLGHANVTTTQIYTLVTLDKVRESYFAAHPRAK